MGVKCKIHYRENGTVEVVEAPNGESSNLYSEALNHTNSSSEALNLWTVPYTLGFIGINGEWNKLYNNKPLQRKLSILNSKNLTDKLQRSKSAFEAYTGLFLPLSSNKTDLEVLIGENILNQEVLDKLNYDLIEEDYGVKEKDIRNLINIYEKVLDRVEERVSTTSLILDKNGEPRLKDVLDYLKFVRNQGKKLTNKELSEIGNNLYSLPINTFEELYNELRSTFYKNGVFEISKDILEDSILYTELEVLDIISNPNLQNSIKSLVEKIETQFLSENDSKINELIKTYFFQEEDLIIDSTSSVGIGKHNTLNPFVIEKEMASYLAGVTNRNEFDNKFKDIPYEAIVAKYQTDSEFANRVYEKYSKLKVIPVMRESNGVVTRKSISDTSTTLKEVLVTDIPTLSITDDLFLLAELDIQLWEENQELIKEVLKQVESNLIPFNIDVIGLSESIDEKTQTEVLEFINEIDVFIESINTTNVDENGLNNLAEKIDLYFNNIKVDDNIYKEVSESNSKRTLVKLNPISDDLTLFKNNSLIRTNDGYFHKVNVIENIDNLYETVYNLTVRDNSLLPKQAFYPTAFDSNNTFNLGKLNKIENKNLILQDFKRFVASQAYKYNKSVDSQNTEDLKKMVMYQMMFKHPVNSIEKINVDKELLKINNLNTDTGYLMSTFISDFYNYQLTNKFENTELYNNVLKHFSVDERGIILKQDDLHTKQQINLLSPSNEILNNLRQYVLITKDSSLDGLFEPKVADKTVLNNRDTYRNLYMSNPDILPIFKGQYDIDGDLLITPNETNNFIKTSKSTYEKVAQHGNATFFRELPNAVSPFFKDYGLKVKSQTKINLENYKAYIVDNNSSLTKVSNLYSKTELGNINDQIDECQ